MRSQGLGHSRAGPSGGAAADTVHQQQRGSRLLQGGIHLGRGHQLLESHLDEFLAHRGDHVFGVVGQCILQGMKKFTKQVKIDPGHIKSA